MRHFRALANSQEPQDTVAHNRLYAVVLLYTRGLGGESRVRRLLVSLGIDADMVRRRGEIGGRRRDEGRLVSHACCKAWK